jgi:xylulokinase
MTETAMLCAPLFDARAAQWSDEGARAVGVAMRALPRVARAHDVLGGVSRQASAATGLRQGTPVVAGGGDFAASALGAGVIDEGQACLMLGTAGNLLMPMNEPCFDARLINSHHVGCDRWLSLGGTLCGAALEWFRRVFAAGVPWETLEAEAQAVEPAPGIIALPYFQGERTPVWDERVRAVFAGIELAHGRGHLYRALLDGIALGFRHCMTVAEERGVTFDHLVAANGAGRSPLLRQTLADALGLPLTWSSAGGGGTLAGAAILAGLGTGVLVSPRWREDRAPGLAATGSVAAGSVRHHPDARSHLRLSDAFARRLALHEALRAGRER